MVKWQHSIVLNCVYCLKNAVLSPGRWRIRLGLQVDDIVFDENIHCLWLIGLVVPRGLVYNPWGTWLPVAGGCNPGPGRFDPRGRGLTDQSFISSPWIIQHLKEKYFWFKNIWTINMYFWWWVEFCTWKVDGHLVFSGSGDKTVMEHNISVSGTFIGKFS